ncbi:MAG: D-alanyl-D-alanine carboxypeptidase family protein [Clostridia bacterium]|nr:D-alanyl-D-alanine carboxypeptidase family protein [Clostridia bacterium]
MKRIICFLLCAFMLPSAAFAEKTVDTDAKSVILTEAATGEVLYEENPDEQLPIASVTKIMTMLLIAEAVDSGRITLEDMVPVSENAMSYGGSTMFLEAGEELSVHDMLKGIAVASANDGCVAMAEFLEGSEAAFVEKMNEKAHDLGMENTCFKNTNGLDEDGHYSSARDVAIMSRELLKHPMIFEFTTIWTDTLRDGKFKLANTNKLIRFYSGANGLKTGSTSKALCCISAAAKRDDMQLIAVVLGAPTSAKRFSSARAMLDYGFANYRIASAAKSDEELKRVPVKKGVTANVGIRAAEDYSVLRKKSDTSELAIEIVCDEYLNAPISEGDKIGTLIIGSDDSRREIDLLATESVNKKSLAAMAAELFYRLIEGE